MNLILRRPSLRRSAVCVSAAVVILAGQGMVTAQRAEAPDIAVKAALLFNFMKFVQWPALAPGAPILACIAGDEDMVTAVVDTVNGHQIGGHLLNVSRIVDSVKWPVCQLLFLGAAESRQSAADLVRVRTLQVLTVGETSGFAQHDGIIELYVEAGRRRFAINTDAAERSGLRISSRLLGLAKIVRD